MNAPKSGDPCRHPGCTGWLIVTRSKRLGAIAKRWLHCWRCLRPSDPPTVEVPSEAVPIRRRRAA